mmetsp:Transcript_45434/g.120874  ORF Transcript_45434/g.120874 Transcript_45434/m.120874 type:complete len:127 (-) Transcript_45434:187-567(-)
MMACRRHSPVGLVYQHRRRGSAGLGMGTQSCRHYLAIAFAASAPRMTPCTPQISGQYQIGGLNVCTTPGELTVSSRRNEATLGMMVKYIVQLLMCYLEQTGSGLNVALAYLPTAQPNTPMQIRLGL